MPGDTFSFQVSGGTVDDQNVDMFPALDVVFGITKTYSGIGVNGQDITVSSSETIGATTTTDTIIVSTPANFYTLDTFNGSTVYEYAFRMGDMYNGDDPLRLQRFTGILDVTGYLTFSGGTLALNPDWGLGQDVQSFNANEFIFSSFDANPPPISQYNINSFSFVLNYPNAPAAVPEPSTLALGLLGLLGGMVVVVRRRRFAA